MKPQRMEVPESNKNLLSKSSEKDGSGNANNSNNNNNNGKFVSASK